MSFRTEKLLSKSVYIHKNKVYIKLNLGNLEQKNLIIRI